MDSVRRNEPLGERLQDHQQFLRSLARGLCFDPESAEDLIQETWLAALTSGMRLDRAPTPWLARVARNLAAENRVRSVRRGQREARAARARAKAAPSAEEVALRESARREAIDAVLSLHEPYRSVLLLRYYDDLPPRRVARIRGVPVETVRSQLRRGLAQVRERLDRAHGGDRRSWALALLPLALPAYALVPTLTRAALGAKARLGAFAIVLVIGATLAAVWSPELGGPRRAGPVAAPAEAPATTSARAAPASAAPEDLAAGGTPAADAPAAELRGLVLDPAGKVAPGARVIVHPSDVRASVDPDAVAPPAVAVTAGPDGRFVASLPEAAPLLGVVATLPSHAPAIVFDVEPGRDVVLRLGERSFLPGLVVDADNRPVPGATVRARTLVGAVARETTTWSDAAGRFAVENPEAFGQAAHTGIAGVVMVDVRAPGYAPLVALDQRFGARGAQDDLVLVLQRGGQLRGRLVDAATGTPIAGAPVVLWSAAGLEMGFRAARGLVLENPWQSVPALETATGLDGAFVFEHAPCSGFGPSVYSLRGASGATLAAIVGAMPSGYAARFGEVPRRDEGAALDVEIACSPAGAVRGRVIDASGRPVSGAAVRAVRAGAPHAADAGMIPGFGGARATTDATGAFMLPAVPCGDPPDLEVTVALLPGGARATVRVAPLAGGLVDAGTLVLPTPPVAVLDVVDGAGQPVCGAWAAASDASQARSDHAGRLVIAASGTSEPQRVAVSARGYATALSPPFSATSNPTPTRVVLRRGHRLEGRVAWPDGTPVAGALVRAALPARRERLPQPPPDGGAWVDADELDLDDLILEEWIRDPDLLATMDLGEAVTDSAGRFAIDDLPSGPCDLVATAAWGDDGRVARTAAALVPTNAAAAVLTLEEPAVAWREARLVIEVVDAASQRRVLAPVAIVAGGAGEPRVTHACRPGTIRFSRLPPGAVTLVVRARGYVERAIDVDRTLASGGAARVELERAPAVRGRVGGVEPAVDGVRQIRFVDRRGAVAARAEIGPAGDYEARGLAPGDYSVWISGRSGVETARPTEPRTIAVRAGAPVQTFDCAASADGLVIVTIAAESLPLHPLAGGRSVPPIGEDRARWERSSLVLIDADGREVDAFRRLWRSYSYVFSPGPGRYAVKLAVDGFPVAIEPVTLNGPSVEKVLTLP
jgi:RNA polymerase sigma-70 factor (ECF subfamily)